MEESSEIQSFYRSNSVLITGGTGFLGRVLIEKLLRSTEVSTVYILIRPKKGKCVNRRFDELFECEIFDRLKRECPKFEHRVKAVPGDCSMSGLGLSITDRQTIISEINVVFHVAATVKFDENLKRALNINVNGTKDLLQLAEQMVNLKSLIHVSTAYSNCPLNQIDEVFYKFPYSYEDIVTIIEKLSEYEVAELTPRIIGEWPNTYTFTKALAESLIKDVGGGLPIGIFRPGVVISTYREPMPGWTDHLNGPGGVAAAAISGVMRTLICGRTNVADLVPVDACVAGLVASAWDVANRNENAHRERPSAEESIPIYNYVSSTENPITWYEFTHYTLNYGKKYPIRNAKWVPFMILTPNSLLYFFLTMFLHILPGFLIDAFLVLFGKKPKMLRVYKKIHKLSNIISYFCIRSWSFTNCNTTKLWKKLNRVDRDLFPMSMTTVHWLIYMRNYIKGVRTYLLKDPDSTLHVAKKRNNLLNIVSNILTILFILGISSTFPMVLKQFTSYIF